MIPEEGEHNIIGAIYLNLFSMIKELISMIKIAFCLFPFLMVVSCFIVKTGCVPLDLKYCSSW